MSGFNLLKPYIFHLSFLKVFLKKSVKLGLNLEYFIL